MVSHTYSKMSSDTGASVLKSNNNILTSNFLFPTHWKKHEVGLKLTGNFLSDNNDFSNNMVSAELGNKLEFRTGGFRWRPRHTIKTSSSESQNPDGTNSELDSKLAFECTHPNLWVLGRTKLKGQYDWRRKENEKGSNTKNRYYVELGLIKKFNRDYKLMLSSALDNEAYTTEVAAGGIQVSQRDPEHRTIMRIDLQGKVAEGVELGANAIWISTNESKITKYSASARLILPVIDLPIRSLLVMERREMDGLRPQELLQLETKVAYSFRNISLILSHRLTDEILVSEHYVYSEFLGKISRSFDIF